MEFFSFCCKLSYIYYSSQFTCGWAQVRAILLGTVQPLKLEATADGGRRDTSRDFLPNNIVGFGRPQLLTGLRLTKVRAARPPTHASALTAKTPLN